MSGWKHAAAILSILMAALALRLSALEVRPIHTDEAVHAYILGEMLEGGLYRYNAQDCHGPTLYFLAWPVLKAFGVTSLASLELWQLRVIPVCIGIGNILALMLFCKELGRGAVLFAACLMTVVVPFVYYDRYFIHESLFLFFTLLYLVALWRLSESFRLGESVSAKVNVRLAAVVGGSVALLFTTKETAVITVAASFAAFLASHDVKEIRRWNIGQLPWGRIAVAGLVAGSVGSLIFVAFYTSFGLHMDGLTDSARAVPRFMNRAAGEGHEKAWWTYLGWLLMPNRFSFPWAGWTLFAFAAVAVAYRWKEKAIRFIGLFVGFSFLIYSTIPYKTPWLMMTVLGPLCLLAGEGMHCLLQTRFRVPAVYLFVVLGCFMIRESWSLCMEDPADERNPYAYSPTVPDFEGVVRRLDLYAAEKRDTAHGPAHQMLIYVVGADYWPMPWYLRRHPRVGYFANVPADVQRADAVIASGESVGQVQSQLGNEWIALPFGLRPGVFIYLFLRKEADQATAAPSYGHRPAVMQPRAAGWRLL